jgi:hypothetical protein
MSISALSECGSGAELFVDVERGPGGGWALYESGRGAVQSWRPLPSVTGCHRNSISFLVTAIEGPVTKIDRSSVSVAQVQATMPGLALIKHVSIVPTSTPAGVDSATVSASVNNRAGGKPE